MSEENFTGFGENAIKFLKALGFHQSREWFHENKKLYESDCKTPLQDFVEATSRKSQELGLPLQGNRKTSPFRVNRDVRFAKEKHPYNTHMSAVLTRDGTKKEPSGVYVMISPDVCRFSAGIWMPDGPQLRAIREQIIARKDEFLAIETELTAKGYEINDENNLKRMPPAFKTIEDPELQRLLRHRSFVINKRFDETDIFKPALVDQWIAIQKDALSLLNFGWRAMDPLREEIGEG